MGYLTDIVIGALSRIMAGELSAHALARWIVEYAAARLPMDVRFRFREEWLAHLEETPGALRKLWHSVGCFVAAGKVASPLNRQDEQEEVVLVHRDLLDFFNSSRRAEGFPSTPEGFLEAALMTPDRFDDLQLNVTFCREVIFINGGHKLRAERKPQVCENEQQDDFEVEFFGFPYKDLERVGWFTAVRSYSRQVLPECGAISLDADDFYRVVKVVCDESKSPSGK
jgi:hypothetical protein